MKTFLVAFLLVGTAMAGRSLMEDGGPKAEDHCTCTPYAETRTPAEICATKDPYDDSVFCNEGFHFPNLKSGNCSTFYQCGAGGVAAGPSPCGEGTQWDVSFNTCVHKSTQIDGKEVCTNKCTGMLYKPYMGCYNVKKLSSGEDSWGLFVSGEDGVGCGLSGKASAGVGNSGMFSAGCGNSGTAAWGRDNSNTGTCKSA